MVQLIKAMDIIMDKPRVLLKTMGSSICNISNNNCILRNIRMTMIKFMRRMKKIKIMSRWPKSKWRNLFKCSKEDKWRSKTISRIMINSKSTTKRSKMKMVSCRRKENMRENTMKGRSLKVKEKRRLSFKGRVKSIWRVMIKERMMMKIMKSSIRMGREKRKEKWWMKKNITGSWLNNNNSKWLKIKKMTCMKKINDLKAI